MDEHADCLVGAGILVLRHSAATAGAIAAWADRLRTSPLEDEATAFGALAGPGKSALPASNRIFRGFGDAVSLGVLPLATFSNGHTHCVQHLFQVQPNNDRCQSGFLFALAKSWN